MPDRSALQVPVKQWLQGYLRRIGSKPVVLYGILLGLILVLPILDVAELLPKETNTHGAEPAALAATTDKGLQPLVAPELHSMPLAEEQRDLLASLGWNERVGDALGVWVSIKDQRFLLIQSNRILWETRCSTSAKGPGFKVNSFQTPLGWHRVVEKAGEGKPWGQVFREKRPTKKIWRRGDPVKKALVLTRVLALAGEEPGRNQGGKVDSYARGIYIHGTNDEENIGKPTSRGCVRLTNDDAIQAFHLIPEGALVLITE